MQMKEYCENIRALAIFYLIKLKSLRPCGISEKEYLSRLMEFLKTFLKEFSKSPLKKVN